MKNLHWIATRSRASLIGDLENRLKLLEGELKPFSVQDDQQRFLATEIADVRSLIDQVALMPEEGIPVLTEITVNHMLLSYDQLPIEHRSVLS